LILSFTLINLIRSVSRAYLPAVHHAVALVF